MSLTERLNKLRASPTFKARALTVLLMFMTLSLFMSFAVTPVAATDGNITAATTFYGLSIMIWAFIILAFVMLGIYFIMKNPFEFVGFLVLAILAVVMYVMGF